MIIQCVAISTTPENDFRVSDYCGLGKVVEWVHATCNNVSSEHIYGLVRFISASVIRFDRRMTFVMTT